MMSEFTTIEGRAIVIPNDDVDTDRIIPARFMRDISFAGLEQHIFDDDRHGPETHVLDCPESKGSRLMFVGKNFGCGSSREHAPQGIHRWGIDAIVGESFAEIFAANSVAVGMPCIEVSGQDMHTLRELLAERRDRDFILDLAAKTIRSGNMVVQFDMAEGPRQQFLLGTWNATDTLLSAGDRIERTADGLPYLKFCSTDQSKQRNAG